jgi:hypothetical protein
LLRLDCISLYIIRGKPLFLNGISRKRGEKLGFQLSRILENFFKNLDCGKNSGFSASGTQQDDEIATLLPIWSSSKNPFQRACRAKKF